MAAKQVRVRFDQRAVLDWSLYIVRFTDQSYYVGITSRKDFMLRINQHGGRTGARVNLGKTLDEIVQIQHLGKMNGLQAGRIENDMTLEYRKKYGYKKVRGGHDILGKASVIPTYTPGSWQATIFILVCLTIALLCILFIATMNRD